MKRGVISHSPAQEGLSQMGRHSTCALGWEGMGWFWRSHFTARQAKVGDSGDSSGPEAKSRRPASVP